MAIESDIIKDILVKVAKIWDELGIDQAYRKNQIDLTSEKIIEVYNSLLKKEETYKEDIIKDIISGLESLCSMSTELGETVNDNHQLLSSMTLFQRSEYIETEKSKLRKRIQDRMGVIEELEAGIDEYSKEMELKDFNQSMIDESTLQGNDYSMDKISSLGRKLNVLKTQRDDLFEKIQKISIEIVELWEELRISPDTELEKSILLMNQTTIDKRSPISLSLPTLTVLEQKRDKLHVIKAEHEEMVCNYARRITLLWDKLNIPQDERETFFSKTVGLGSDVIEACVEELERIEEIRRNCLLDLIEKVLEKIEIIYNHLHLPIEKLYQVVEDNGLDRNKETEDLLDLYELELVRVTKLYELSKPLLLLIEKRETIRNYKIEYEQTILGDKERLLSKKFDRARFEKEKELSTAFQKLPAIEENLKKQLLLWQQTYGQSFTYEGFNYLELMQQQADAEKKLKESEKLRKEREKQNKVTEDSHNHKTNGINSNSNISNNSNNNGGGGGGIIKKSTSHQNIISSSSCNNNYNNGLPKTPTSSKVFKSVQTPSTPKTPKTLKQQTSTLEQLTQSPYSAAISTKPLLKKRAPLSPLPIKNFTNTPGTTNTIGRSTAASKISPKKKIQFSLNTNININNNNNSSKPTNIIKKPITTPIQRNAHSGIENRSTPHQNQQVVHIQQKQQPISVVSPASSVSSTTSSSSSSSHNTSSYYINSHQQQQHQQQQQQHGIYKSNSNDSILINNHQYNDDLIMNDTFDPSSMI